MGSTPYIHLRYPPLFQLRELFKVGDHNHLIVTLDLVATTRQQEGPLTVDADHPTADWQLQLLQLPLVLLMGDEGEDAGLVSDQGREFQRVAENENRRISPLFFKSKKTIVPDRMPPTSFTLQHHPFNL